LLIPEKWSFAHQKVAAEQHPKKWLLKAIASRASQREENDSPDTSSGE
jgi:hypothetical protein